ncbi:hypothetical protein DINM_005779 [Dirofilaria immitis]|nr:hypothetical protein [Dirofilaria immitis]
MAVIFNHCWFILIALFNLLVYSLEPVCFDINCYIPLHSKIGSKYSVYGITQSGIIFIVDMMTFSSANFLHDLMAIDEKSEFFIIDAPKARIILPSCNWTIYNNILYCEIYWPMAKFVRIRRCYHPKYYYSIWTNKLHYLCYNDNDISNEVLFVDEGLKLGLLRYGYKDAAPEWLLSFEGENVLKPETEYLLSCIVEDKIRYTLQTAITQFCILELSALSFRMSVKLLPNGFNKTALTKFLKYNESWTSLPVEDDHLPVNVLPLIVTRQKSMIEDAQILGDIDTFEMDTFISIILAIPIYICFSS